MLRWLTPTHTGITTYFNYAKSRVVDPLPVVTLGKGSGYGTGDEHNTDSTVGRDTELIFRYKFFFLKGCQFGELR